jgi:hypothetical protein
MVELPRAEERDSLVSALRERGLDVREADDRVLEIPCGSERQQQLCDEIVGELEAWIAETGVPFVPVQLEDRVVLRPPGS